MDKDDIPLKDFKSPKTSDDERDDEISTTYNSIKSRDTLNYKNNKTDNANNSDDENQEDDQVNKPLLDKIEDIELKNIARESSDNEPITIAEAEAESLLQQNDIQETNIDGEVYNSKNDVNLIQKNTSFLKRLEKILKPSPHKIVFLLIVIGIIFMSVFLPKCINRLEYNQIAIARSSLTGKLNEKAYGPGGFHILLPWQNWIIFDKTIQSIELKELSIFTTDKLQVKVTFNIYYLLDKNNLVNFYRKFGNDYKSILISICKSELLNNGLKFSIDDYRTNRMKIRSILKDKIRKKLESEYLIKFFELFIERIKFTKEINRLNLVRMLNGIYNEKAMHEKKTNLTIADTQYRVQILKNKAKEVINSAVLEANNTIIKKRMVDLSTQLEITHLKSLNNSLYELKFYSSRITKNDTQKAMSFCYLSSLINNDKIKIIQPDQNAFLKLNNQNNQGYSSRIDGMIGLISL